MNKQLRNKKCHFISSFVFSSHSDYCDCKFPATIVAVDVDVKCLIIHVNNYFVHLFSTFFSLFLFTFIVVEFSTLFFSFCYEFFSTRWLQLCSIYIHSIYMHRVKIVALYNPYCFILGISPFFIHSLRNKRKANSCNEKKRKKLWKKIFDVFFLVEKLFHILVWMYPKKLWKESLLFLLIIMKKVRRDENGCRVKKGLKI